MVFGCFFSPPNGRNLLKNSEKHDLQIKLGFGIDFWLPGSRKWKPQAPIILLKSFVFLHQNRFVFFLPIIVFASILSLAEVHFGIMFDLKINKIRARSRIEKQAIVWSSFLSIWAFFWSPKGNTFSGPGVPKSRESLFEHRPIPSCAVCPHFGPPLTVLGSILEAFSHIVGPVGAQIRGPTPQKTKTGSRTQASLWTPVDRFGLDLGSFLAHGGTIWSTNSEPIERIAFWSPSSSILSTLHIAWSDWQTPQAQCCGR